MNKRSLIALAIVAAVAAPVAFAQDQSATQVDPPVTQETPVEIPSQVPEVAEMPTTPASFADLDADHDGRISIDEAGVDATLSGDFTTRDADNDGFVTEAEFRADAQPDMPQSQPDEPDTL